MKILNEHQVYSCCQTSQNVLTYTNLLKKKPNIRILNIWYYINYTYRSLKYKYSSTKIQLPIVPLIYITIIKDR